MSNEFVNDCEVAATPETVNNPLVEETALVTTDGKEVFFGGQAEQVFTNIDMSSPLGKALSVQCFSGADMANTEIAGKTFYLKAFLLHTVRMVDEKTGEVTYPARTVLIDKDNRTVSFVSEGVKTGIGRLMAAYGPGPYEPALPIKVVDKPTRKGYRTKNIIVDISALEL